MSDTRKCCATGGHRYGILGGALLAFVRAPSGCLALSQPGPQASGILGSGRFLGKGKGEIT